MKGVHMFNLSHQSSTSTRYVCRILFDRTANALIMSFHKRWEIDGTDEVNNKAVKTVNIKVLERSTCLVGDFINRRIVSGSPPLLIASSLRIHKVCYLQN